MRVEERDKLILREVERWNACGSRHIRFLAGFSGQRAADRRLKILRDAGYLERKKFLYGVPGIYFLTADGRKLIQVSPRPEKVKIEQIIHDMSVLDSAIYLMQKKQLSLQDITTEKQLHRLDGFGIRKHRPDFVFVKDEMNFCVEVELTQKAKSRFLNIIKDNFMNYDVQIWIVPETQPVIFRILEENQKFYTNIEILPFQEITDYFRQIK